MTKTKELTKGQINAIRDLISGKLNHKMRMTFHEAHNALLFTLLSRRFTNSVSPYTSELLRKNEALLSEQLKAKEFQDAAMAIQAGKESILAKYTEYLKVGEDGKNVVGEDGWFEFTDEEKSKEYRAEILEYNEKKRWEDYKNTITEIEFIPMSEESFRQCQIPPLDRSQGKIVEADVSLAFHILLDKRSLIVESMERSGNNKNVEVEPKMEVVR